MRLIHYIFIYILFFQSISLVSFGQSAMQDTILQRLERAEQMQINNDEAALQLLQETLQLAIEQKELYGELKAHAAIGLYYYEKAQLDDAIASYQHILTIAPAIDSLQLKAWGLMRIGNVYLRLRRLDKAKSNMEEALSIFQELGKKLNQAQALGNLANIYMYQGDKEIGLQYYKKAYQIADEERDEALKAGMELSISFYYLMSGDGTTAIPYIERSLSYAVKTKQADQVAMGYGNLAYAYSLIGNYDKAFKNYQICIDTARNNEFIQIECDTYKDMSETYKKSGDLKQAMVYQTKYYALRDTIMGRETQDRVSELQVQFETVEQQQQIEQLQNQQKISQLQLSLLVVGVGFLGLMGWLIIQNQRNKLREKQAIIANNKEIHRLEKELMERALQQKVLEQEKIEADAKALKQQEAEARKYAQVLENSNKELESFAHIVSHDLREPLRMVSFYVQRIQRSLDEENKAKTAEYFDFAIDGAKRMDKLIRGILNLAKVQKDNLNLKSLSLNEMAYVATQNLQAIIETKKAQIHYEGLPTIKGDQYQIIQLFQNMISNGIKYNNSEIPKVCISHEKVEDKIILYFKDNGIGISEEYHNRIFKMFQRLEGHQVSGSGIGLATCQKIVERHGGTIEVHSAVGKGSTFKVSLPI